MKDIEAEAKLIREISRRIVPMTEGRDPAIQQAVLAHLLAMNLAAHQDMGNPESETIARLRDKMIALFVELVRALVPVYGLAVSQQTREPPPSS